jgi:hypothetical protein
VAERLAAERPALRLSTGRDGFMSGDSSGLLGRIDSLSENDPVAFWIRDHAFVVGVARPSGPIEKQEPVVLQSFRQGVDCGPRAELNAKVCVSNELARAL